MPNDFNCSCPVHIACGHTDLRRGIDGLAGIVENQFQMNPFQCALFLFCGRRDRIKTLYWEGDGFLLLYKRLESGSFQWPRSGDEVRALTAQQYRWLMEGLSIEQQIQGQISALEKQVELSVLAQAVWLGLGAGFRGGYGLSEPAV